MRNRQGFGRENGVFTSKTCEEEDLRRVVHGLHELSSMLSEKSYSQCASC